jgi:hypothetical protein
MYHRLDCEVVHVAVACSGPQLGTIRGGPFGARRSRAGADLKFVFADLDFYVNQCRRASRSPEQVISAFQPSVKEFRAAIASAMDVLATRSTRDGWNGGGISFAYAGHGAETSGALVLADGEYTGQELADAVAGRFGDRHHRLGIELLLDSCYSGAFLIDFVSHAPPNVVLRDCYLACLHDQCAWEMEELGHGAMTFTLKHPGNSNANPARLATAVRMKDNAAIAAALHAFVPNGVEWLTEGDQSMILVTSGHNVQVCGAGDFELPDVVTADRFKDALRRAAAAPYNEVIAF